MMFLKLIGLDILSSPFLCPKKRDVSFMIRIINDTSLGN